VCLSCAGRKSSSQGGIACDFSKTLLVSTVRSILVLYPLQFHRGSSLARRNITFSLGSGSSHCRMHSSQRCVWVCVTTPSLTSTKGSQILVNRPWHSLEIGSTESSFIESHDSQITNSASHRHSHVSPKLLTTESHDSQITNSASHRHSHVSPKLLTTSGKLRVGREYPFHTCSFIQRTRSRKCVSCIEQSNPKDFLDSYFVWLK